MPSYYTIFLWKSQDISYTDFKKMPKKQFPFFENCFCKGVIC